MLALLLGLLILPYFVNLSGPSLWDATEAFYAETPREMMELGSFVVPSFNYELRLNKPPLSYWLVLPFYHAFGVSQVSERVVNALGASLLILLTFAFGRRLLNWRAGLLGAALVATTPRLVLIAQKSIIDTYFTLFVAAALFLFWTLAAGGTSRAVVVMFYVILGLGVLTKGPLGLVLTGGVIFFFLLLTKRWPLLRRMNLPLGMLILAGMILPWYVAIYLRFGWEPITAFILRENLGRLTSDIDWSSRGPFYYIPALLGDFFPWSLFLIPAGFMVFRLRSQREDHHQSVVFLSVWMVFMFLFFSLARNKHEYYLLPLYPAAAVLIGGFFVHLMDKTVGGGERRGAQIITWVVGIVLITGGIILGLLIKQVFRSPPASYTLLVLIGGGLWLLWQASRRNLRRVPLSLIGLMLSSVLLYQIVYLPVIEPYRPTKALCHIIMKQAQPEDLVGSYKFSAPSMTFYLRRKMFGVIEPERIRHMLDSDRRVFCLMREGDFRQLKQVVSRRLVILGRRPLLTLRLNAMWHSRAREDIPHLLLISNRHSQQRPRLGS